MKFVSVILFVCMLCACKKEQTHEVFMGCICNHCDLQWSADGYAGGSMHVKESWQQTITMDEGAGYGIRVCGHDSSVVYPGDTAMMIYSKVDKTPDKLLYAKPDTCILVVGTSTAVM